MLSTSRVIKETGSLFRPRDKDLTKNKLTRSRTSLIVLLLSLAGLPCPGQDLELIEEPADVAAPTGGEEAENSPADWFSLDKEYQSGAVAGEEVELRKEVELARNQFKAKEWVAGQALIDGVLARITSADYRKERLLKAARKLRELEKLPAKEEQPNPAGKPPANNQQATDDLRIPTAEVYSIDQVRYLPLADAMRELLLSLPEEARAAYRSTYDAPARQALEAARKLPFNESHDALRAVAERYPLSRAGREAWERLAGRLADSGRLVEAAATLATRLTLPFDATSSSSRQETLAQAAVLNLMAGNLESGRRYLEEIVSSHPDQLVRLRGEALLGAALADSPLLKSLTEYAKTSAAAPSQWPAPLGGYEHAGSAGNPEKLPLLGTEARWIHHFSAASTAAGSSTSSRPVLVRAPIAINAGRSSSSLYRGAHPALQLVSNGDNIFFREGTSLVSLETGTGKRKWTHLLDKPDNHSLPQGRFTPQRRSPGQEDYSDLGTRSLCIYKDSEGQRRIVMLDHSTQIGFLRSGQAVYRQNRLLCFDAENGKLVWRAGKTEDKRDPIYGLAFTAPPTPAGGLLVAPAVRESGFYMAGITYEGNIKWLTRLYSFNSSYYQGYGKQFLMGSSLAASDGIAYSAPGTGMVCAVEASQGRLLWLSRYRAGNRERPGNTWIHSQPVLVSGAEQKILLAAPADSNYLTSFDAGNGRLLWERSFTTTSNQLLGADEEKIYISGSSAIALSLAKGEDVWKTRPTGSAAGMGCLVGGHIYLPRSYQTIVKLDREEGTVVQKLRFRDERVPAKFNNSLFAIDDQLFSLGGWGIASILPQQESWKRFAGKPGARRFEQARLLESEGKYAESLEIYYELLTKVKSGSLRNHLRDEIISAVTRVTAENGDPAPIDRMLSYGRTGRSTPLISKRSDYLRWRLKEASLLLKKSPSQALAAYTALLAEDGKFALSGDGNLVDARLYSIDVLRRLRYDTPAAKEDEDPAAAQELKQALDRLLASEDKRFADMLSGEPGEEALRKIALFGPHTPSAAEAQARLAVIELAAGHPQNARSHLRMLCRDYPLLAGLPEIAQLLKQTAAANPEARLLRGIRQPGKEAPLVQAYWLSEEEGTLVGAAAGSEPFPVTFSLKANKLVAKNQAGNTIMERTLTGFPKIDTIKMRLKSNIEEPAVAHIAGDRMVLFTAAGCYAFELPGKSSPAAEEAAPGEHEEPFNATGFKLAWVQNYPHALEKYRQQRASFGSIRTSTTRNLFPKAYFSSGGDLVVLMPGGKLVCIDGRSGKFLWRAGPENAAVKGDLVLQGRNFLSQSTSPAAMLRFTLAGEGIRKLETWDLVTGPKAMSGAQSIPGIADVMSGVSLEVRAPASGRILWNKKSSHKLLHATAESIWLGGAGQVSIVSIRSGQSLHRIPLPGTLQAAHRFENTPGETVTLACSSATPSNSYYCANCGRMHTRSSSGPKELSASGVALVHIDKDYKTLWETRLSAGNTVYDGNRHILEDGRWLFVFNEQDTSSEKWYTRVSVVDPDSGKSELWLQVEIASKGTGLLPRISPVAGGLAVGNSEGYGWFTTADLTLPEKDD